MKNENEHYLSDWLADKISDNQLRQLVSEADFLAFQKIKSALNNYSVLEPNMDHHFAAIKEKYNAKKTATRGRAEQSEAKPRSVIPMWSYAVAASLLLFLGLYQFYFFSNEVQTDFGFTKTIVLKDNSNVTLNAKSKIVYPNLFQYNRKIRLEGEAFFEVQKGSSFIVITALGEVRVLGTKFNVSSFDDYFEVICYEGKVSVKVNKKTTILTKGESVRFCNDTFENWADENGIKPLWISGENTFKNVPMKYVFAKFKNQYNVEVAFPKSVEDIKFTGSFANTNIETALKSICIPLHLEYSNTNSRKIQISE